LGPEADTIATDIDGLLDSWFLIADADRSHRVPGREPAGWMSGARGQVSIRMEGKGPGTDDHLAPLGGGWAVWRWVALRSAGLPLQRALDLASPECAAAADRCLDAPDDRVARGTFDRAFADAVAHTARALRSVAGDPWFREAVTWQNLHALRTGVDVLLARPAGDRPTKHRQKEALVTSYLQRYAAKNDTVGFFGPVGWATLTDDGPLLRAEPGPRPIATADVFLEGWCVDALAAALARDHDLRPWFVPRPLPFLHVADGWLHVPLAPPVPLEPTEAAVLEACDGERTARQLAADLVARAVPGLGSEADVLRVLATLAARRHVAWTLEVGTDDIRPERCLRRRLAAIDDDQVRDRAVAALDTLENGRAAVAAAAGNPDELATAIDRLQATFTGLTGADATRRAGQVYAGRSLVYQDCRRDVTVGLGPELAAALGPPLSILLTSARWFTHEAATLYRAALVAIHRDVARRTGMPAVPLADLWPYVQPLLLEDHSQPSRELARRLQARWAALLPLPEGQRRVRFAAADLAGPAAAAFAAPGPGWPMARYHTPDLMVAAASPEAARNGEFELVLGEVHPGLNALRQAFFVAQHPAPAELRAATARDLPGPRVALVATRERGGATPRMADALVLPRDLCLMIADDCCGVPREQALPVGSLVVEPVGETLLARTRDGRTQLDVMELLAELVMFRLVNRFDILPPARHAPRVSIDRLVVRREQWRFAAEELAFARTAGEPERFLDVHRWKRAHDLPRHVFVKTPTETKPFFADLDSLASVDVLARAVRRASDEDEPVVVTEMLPGPDAVWLADADGRRYTSELRMVAVDRR
jgi:hypothetical protein